MSALGIENAAGVSNRIGWTAIAQRVLDYCSTEAKKVSGLSLTQSRTLFHLAVYPGKKTASVANSLNLRLTTAASALEAICKQGYATKTASFEDSRRGTQFYLTERGYAELPLYIEGFERVFEEFRSIVGSEVLEETLRLLLPAGTISMVETCVDDTTLKPGDIYERLQVPEQADPESALFDKAMYVEKFAWSLEEIDKRSMPGMPRREKLVLRALADLQGVAEVRVLRKLLVMKPTTASNALKGLQKADYVSRVDDPENRRVVIASLTDSGREVERQSRPSFDEVFDECFPGFAEQPVPEITLK